MIFNTDPFAQDKKEIKLYGLKINKQHSTLTRDTDETPNTTTHTITMVKAESDAIQCRNLMAVNNNNSLVAYSLAKPLIRVMNPETGMKTLLRGHEGRILDVRFSSTASVSPTTANQTLCSVDDGDSSNGGHHTFIWSIENVSGEIGFSILNKFFLNASIVESHPIQANTWIIATNNPVPSVGIISGTLDGARAQKYSELPLFKTLGSDYTLIDMSFSLDGKYLALAVQSKYASKVLLYSVPSIPVAALPPGFTQELTECASVFVTSIYSVRFTSVGLVTASKAADSTATSANVVVQVYNIEACGSEIAVTLAQSVTTMLPLFQDSSASPPVLPSLSPMSSSGLSEFGLCTSVPGSKFLVLYHRRSNFIASYAINPLKAVGYPLYHATMIDLKFPIDSIFCNLVSGQDHFSSEIIDQLQLSCFQAQPSLQLAIQQFRIAVDSLASKSSEIEDIDSDEDEITPQVSPITSTAEPFVSPFTNSPLFGSDDLISAGVGQGSMLKMLKSTGTINATTTTSNIATPASTRASTRASATNTSTATPVVNVSNIRKSDPVMTTPMEADAMSLASAGPLSPTLSVASEKAHSQSKSILGLLKGIMVPTPTPAASTASEKILPVTAISAPPTIPVTTTSVLAAASVVSTSVVEEEEEEEEVSSTMAPSTTTVPRVPSYSSASPDIALDTGSANSSISRALSEVKYQIVELRKEQATKTAESHIHIKDTVIEKIQKAVHESTHSSNKKLAITIKELLKGAVEEQQSQLSAVTTAAVRSSIDSEVKKSLDSTLKNKAFTDEITKAVADAVKTEIIASINLSLPQIISSTVKEAVTQSLSSTFRLAFENTLLPSFEAGTTRMFAQVEESFDSGLDRLEKQAQYTTESTRQTVDELQGEVASLKSIIGSLENKMSLLINAIESGALTSGGNALSIGTTSNNTDKAQKKLQDPILLLKQGKIPESLECALEYKSIEKLVELLAAMTGPSQLAENCDYLLQLCAIQQLAADFAKTYPIEGTSHRMEWLKGFVSTLISLPLDDPEVKQVISSILSSLKAAEMRIQTNLAGNDGSETANHSNLTDLRIMIAVISSRC